MTKVFGWCLLLGGLLWFNLVGFIGYEPDLLHITGNAAVLIAGAILAK